MKTTLIKLLPLVAAMTLAACGGGGGGGSSSSTADNGNNGNNGPVTPPTSGCPGNQVMINGSCATPADIQVSVPTPSYPSGSVEMTAFQELNAVRQAMGLGLLAQNVKLDQTAKNHTNYIAINIDTDFSVFSHYEDSKKPGYTGYSPSDRGMYTGFGAYVSEVVLTKHPVLVPSAVYDFMATVYHRQLMIQQCPRNVGIAYQDHQSPDGFYANPIVMNFGFPTGSKCQTNASNFVTTYPVDGQTQVRKIMTAEQPFPLLLSDIPKDAYGNYDLANYTSYPISISIEQNQTLTMTSMTVTEEGQTTALPMRILQKTNDPAVFSSNMFFIGYQPFKPQTKYNVVFVGAANGVSFTKKFSFTTA